MTLWVVYPALALVLGVLTSIYLFVAWFRHPKKRPAFILYCSAGLFLMYWFQVPIILTNLGRTTTITAFNFFFAVTFPVTFLALAMIYWGVLDALNIRLNRMLKVLFLAWLLSAAAFFAYHFIIYYGVISTHNLSCFRLYFFASCLLPDRKLKLSPHERFFWQYCSFAVKF